jgi:hypothetical protein
MAAMTPFRGALFVGLEGGDNREDRRKTAEIMASVEAGISIQVLT